MRHNDVQLGKPETIYKDTKANIEALTAVEGMIAYSTDTHEFGSYNGTSWDWGGGSGATAFTELTDAFASYSGLAGEYVKVNAAEDGLETGTPSSGGFTTGDIQQVELYRSTLGGAGQFDVSSISQDYDNLLLRLIAQSDDTVNYGDSGRIYLNNDTTDSNYRAAAYDNTVSNAPLLPYLVTAKGAGGEFSTYELTILGYASTTRMKTIHIVGAGQGDSTYNPISVIRRNNTEAINRITIRPDGYATQQLSIGSFLQIIGIKTVA